MHDATSTPLTRHAGIDVPLLCGPMYPRSNPERVGAVSRAGALGIVQPISLTYVHGQDVREGRRLIRRLAGGKPIGFNALIEASSTTYQNRMMKWVEIALEERLPGVPVAVLRTLKRSSVDGANQDHWQAGRSVSGIHDIKPAGAIVAEFASALRQVAA